MSGPLVFRRQCKCGGWFDWSEWSKNPDLAQCDSCGKTMGQFNREEKDCDNRALLREFVGWLVEKHDIDDPEEGYDDIDQFLKEREDG